MTTPNNATHEAATAAFSFSTTPSNTMNYTTHNQEAIDSNMSSLQGEVDAGYKELVALFGKPTDGDGYKVDAHWALKFEDGMVATIYNWKNGKNYCGEEGKDVQQIRDWHIGGFERRAVDRVQIILDLHREKKQEKKQSDFDEAFASAYDVMETLRKVKGEAYARTVETAMLGRKMQDLMQVSLGICVATDAMPEEVADIMNEIMNHICAKQISLCATNGGLQKDATKADAQELMNWVEKLWEHEQSAAKTLLESQKKKRNQ